MKIFADLNVRTLAEVPEAVRRAERLGFDGVNLNEFVMDPLTAATLAAANTNRVFLSTAIVVAFPRSPMLTAYSAWQVQAFSGGRLHLGLGTQVKGHMERRFSVPWDSPGPRMRDYLLALRAIWDCWQKETPLNYKGKFYSFTLMTDAFNPGPIEYPSIPLYVAAVNPYMCRLAGELCQGIFLAGLCTRKYTEEVVLPNLRAGAEKGGRKLSDIEIAGGGYIGVAENPEEVAAVREATRQQVGFYASTRTYRGALELHGLGEISTKLHELSVQGKWSEMGRYVPEELMDVAAIVGTYDDIVEKIEARHRGLSARITFPLPPQPGPADERVMDVVRGVQAL